MTLYDGAAANIVIYDMESFLAQCVERYLQCAPTGTKMNRASTPFLHDSGDFGPARNPTKDAGAHCEWCGYVAGSAVSQVGEESGSPMNAAQAKPLKETKVVEKEDDRGQLADSASSVLMKIL